MPRGRGRRPVIIKGLSVETPPPPANGFGEDWKQRPIIAWDGEGMNLRGPGKPQNYVLFGCSAETDKPLISRSLDTGVILNYMCDVAQRYPRAVHIAYSFKYDFNMIIKSLSWEQKLQLKDSGAVVIDKGFPSCPESWGYRYYLSYNPGKIFRLTRLNLENKERVSIRIDDVFSFFARKFLVAAESILGESLTEEDREIIEHGKMERGENLWEDIDEVLCYWQSEIRIMERMMNVFRDVMYRAGFRLTQWYGPGAMASYMIRKNKLQKHIQNTPPIPEVHDASKRGYAGGRFELFHIGRYNEPVYGYDINSAYPHALSNAPSLGLEHGEWEYQSNPSNISEFGIYHIRVGYRTKDPLRVYPAMPLFHRDNRGNISYPSSVEGWYWSPEAAVAKRFGEKVGGVEILEGWVWNNDGNRPFKFLQEMFNKRMELGKGNIISMPYKLGPNSMYGKLAQKVGSNNAPPKSHCLPLAGWITSVCRARIYGMMIQIPFDKLIAVETDGIYTTVPPDQMKADYGKGLGQWDVTEYDEMMYVQNGIYHKRKGGKWEEPKSRGIDAASIPLEVIQEYFRNAGPNGFPELETRPKQRFVGLSAAMVGDPTTVNNRHCVWKTIENVRTPGAMGKRIHIDGCPVCQENLSAYEKPHPLVVMSRAGIACDRMSYPHRLPWESRQDYANNALGKELQQIEGDLLWSDGK